LVVESWNCLSSASPLQALTSSYLAYNSDMQKGTYIVKADGERVLFDVEKLRASLFRSGAQESEIEKVIAHVTDELEDGMTTDHIYRHAFSILKNLKNPQAMRRYSLRRALLDLGPTGFPFEKFLGEIFKAKGYETLNNQIVQGACVSHEIDLVAYNETKLIMVESKFHNTLGEKSDLKVALYVKARFDDLSEQSFEYGKRRPLDEGWLMTNTKFTEHAITYGQCAGLRMVGWNYPSKGNIQDMIEDARLHPITCLSQVSVSERGLLLNSGMVLCRHVINSHTKLMGLGISEKKAYAIEAEARLLCSP